MEVDGQPSVVLTDPSQLGFDFLDAWQAGVEPVVAIALPGQATGSGERVFGDEMKPLRWT